jgi:hypothetical protein
MSHLFDVPRTGIMVGHSLASYRYGRDLTYFLGLQGIMECFVASYEFWLVLVGIFGLIGGL